MIVCKITSNLSETPFLCHLNLAFGSGGETAKMKCFRTQHVHVVT